MKSLITGVAFVGALGLATGCDGQAGLLLDILGGGNTTTVRVVNSSSGTATVSVFYGGRQETFEFDLRTNGTEEVFTIPPGASATLSQPCDDLQAVFVEADISFLGTGLGPEETSEVFTDGSDFGCGDTLVFTLANPNLAVLDITFTQQ